MRRTTPSVTFTARDLPEKVYTKLRSARVELYSAGKVTWVSRSALSARLLVFRSKQSTAQDGSWLKASFVGAKTVRELLREPFRKGVNRAASSSCLKVLNVSMRSRTSAMLSQEKRGKESMIWTMPFLAWQKSPCVNLAPLMNVCCKEKRRWKS